MSEDDRLKEGIWEWHSGAKILEIWAKHEQFWWVQTDQDDFGGRIIESRDVVNWNPNESSV